MKTFYYGNIEKDSLINADEIMAGLIKRFGHIEREVEPDPFIALISSIISQQISTKAAVTVEKRLVQLSGGLSAHELGRLSLEEIQSCGMTMRKAEYIKGAVDASVTGKINFDTLHELEDDEAIAVLTSLKGVGIWTAEMLLIFSLERPDILSYLDLGIRRGLIRAYNLEKVSKAEFQAYKDKFSPYGSVASLYLWAMAAV